MNFNIENLSYKEIKNLIAKLESEKINKETQTIVELYQYLKNTGAELTPAQVKEMTGMAPYTYTYLMGDYGSGLAHQEFYSKPNGFLRKSTKVRKQYAPIDEDGNIDLEHKITITRTEVRYSAK